eukprot:1189801-Prorocentrum_minimum.AAC.1
MKIMGDMASGSSKKVTSEMEVEEREAQLEQQILNKYNQVKAMEKELQVLQFQAKQTTAPKKQGGLLLDRSTSCAHEVRDRVTEMRKQLQKEEEILKQKEEEKVAPTHPLPLTMLVLLLKNLRDDVRDAHSSG